MIAHKEKGLEDLDFAEQMVRLSLMPIARASFEKDGELFPVCFFGATLHPKTSQPFEKVEFAIVSPTQLGIQTYDDRGRQAFVAGVRKVLRESKAVSVVLIEEGVRESADGAGQECVMVVFEHQKLGSKVKCWWAPILRTRDADEGDTAKLGEFSEPEFQEKTADGFAGLLDLIS
jgi:hypothetical protein